MAMTKTWPLRAHFFLIKDLTSSMFGLVPKNFPIRVEAMDQML